MAKKKPQTEIRRECIRELEDHHGRLTAEKLVRAASNPKHPMHKDFEWDDAKAGHQHRLDQARTYISAVRVMVTASTKQVKAVGYVRDPWAKPHQGYINTARLRTDREAAEEALLDETTRLQAVFERCRELAAALELEADLEAILGSIKEFEGRIRRRGGSATVYAEPRA